MLLRILCASFIFLLGSNFLFAQKEKNILMTFYDLNVGADLHTANYSNNSSTDFSKLNFATGISGRMQSSFAANFNHNNKFIIADVLSAEAGIGGISSYFSSSNSSLWLNYRFEFGLGMIYRINKKNDIGLNLLPLLFAHDNISQNISGSCAMLRYRYSKIMIEGGVETRRDQIVAWFTNIIANKPLQISLGGRFLFDENKNFGIRCEWLPSIVPTGTENFDHILSVRIFYGIYF